MKKTWTKDELLASRGCYSEKQINDLWNGGRGKTVTLIEILESSVEMGDKRWFLFTNGGLTLGQKRQLALISAKIVLPIFEAKHPQDKRVSDCLAGIDKFNLNEITRDQLYQLRDAADATAAYAAYAAAAAAAYAATAATTAAAAAADATAAYAAKTYSQLLINAFINFVNQNQ